MLDRNIDSIIYQSYIKLGKVGYEISSNISKGLEGTSQQKKLWNQLFEIDLYLDQILDHIEIKNNSVYRIIDITDEEMNQLLSCLKLAAKINDFPIASFIPSKEAVNLSVGGGGGAQGQPGVNGSSAYAVVAFASDSNGTGLSSTPSPSRPYIAFKTSTAPIPFIASSFTGLWVKYIGDNGVGTPGTNGTTYYTYVRYASDNLGTDFSATPSSTRKYVGYLITTTDHSGNPNSSLFNGLWVKYIGEDGAAGANGTNGKTIHITSGPPSSSLGVDGDIAIDTTNYLLYAPKAIGVWPTGVSLIGPVGANGADGIGIPGANGQSQYLFIAYGDDLLGTGFTLTFDVSKDYAAWLVKNDNATPVQSDFDGLWTRYKGDGDRWATVSTTSVTIGTGTKNFVVEVDLAYTSGQNVVIARTGVPSSRMEGKVISYNPTTGDLSVDVTATAGAGTFTDWQVNLQGLATVDPLYTGASPSNITVGGMPSGTTLTGRTISNILEEILIDYLLPTFSAFAMSGQATIVEVGTTISGSKTFTWTTTNSTNVQANTIVIRDETNGIDFLPNPLANDGSESGVAITSVTKNSPDSHTWRIRGTNTLAAVFTRDFIVNWRWKRFYGTSASVTLNEAGIEALLNSSLETTPAGNFSFVAGDYKYFAWPDSFGSPASGIGFRDLSTNLAVAMADATDNAAYSNTQNGWSYALVSVTNVNGQTTNYRVYRTKNTLGGTITIQVTL